VNAPKGDRFRGKETLEILMQRPAEGKDQKLQEVKVKPAAAVSCKNTEEPACTQDLGQNKKDYVDSLGRGVNSTTQYFNLKRGKGEL